MNDKEIIKKLAEAVINNHTDILRDSDIHYCIHCDQQEFYNGANYVITHKSDCPVLLAEEILKEENKCSNYNGTGNENKEDGTDNYCTCNHCGGTGTIEPVKGIEPYSEDYLICNKCDSTFNKEEDKPQFTEEQFNDTMIDCNICEYITPHNYLLLTNKMKEKGYIIPPKSLVKDKEIFTPLNDYYCYKCNKSHSKDKECTGEYCNHKIALKSFDNHGDITHAYQCEKCFQKFIQLPKGFSREDIYVKNQYIEKPEQPEIVHNVLKYKGEYYLKQVATNNCISCALYNKTDCYITGNMCCGEGFNWKSFKNIQITDELACMRKDIGDIYIIVGPESYRGIHVLYGVKDGELISNDKSREYSLKDGYVRLATTEEIKEYMEKNK